MARSITKWAAEGRNSISEGRDISLTEISDLYSEAQQNGAEGLYNAIMHAFYFGVKAGMMQATANRRTKNNGSD